jgi:hypothetical protein
MDIYSLSRNFWDYAYDNPDKIKPNHCALYFFIIEHCNRLGWKKKFGLPSMMSMEAIGIKSHNTYINTLNDLEEIGLIIVVERSKNQYSANIVALSNFDKAHSKALDKALIKHGTKQRESTVQSIDHIDIPIYNNTNIQVYKSTSLQRESDFNFFWDCYNKKVDRSKSEKTWNKLSGNDIDNILSTIEDYVNANQDIKFRKNPSTYLNNKCWNDEIIYHEPLEKKGKHQKNFENLYSLEQKLLKEIEDGTFNNPFSRK